MTQNEKAFETLDALTRDITNNYPEILRARHLVQCGLFQSRSDVCLAIRRKQAPPSIKISSHKTVFPRAGLCAWLLEKARNEVSKVDVNGFA